MKVHPFLIALATTFVLVLIGLPGICIPYGFDNNGLPTSFQIMGDKQSDHMIIKCAQLIQSETDWHNKHPN